MIVEQTAEGELYLLDLKTKERKFVIEKPFMMDSESLKDSNLV